MLKKSDLLHMLTLVDDDAEIMLFDGISHLELHNSAYVGFKSKEIIEASLQDDELETKVYNKIKDKNLPICFTLYTNNIGYKYDN